VYLNFGEGKQLRVRLESPPPKRIYSGSNNDSNINPIARMLLMYSQSDLLAVRIIDAATGNSEQINDALLYDEGTRLALDIPVNKVREAFEIEVKVLRLDLIADSDGKVVNPDSAT
jgi:hypothetical protein